MGKVEEIEFRGKPRGRQMQDRGALRRQISVGRDGLATPTNSARTTSFKPAANG